MSKIAIIVEGQSREPVILSNMETVFFRNVEFEIIHLMAQQNIYMLWQRLKDDDFQTDLIEVIREFNPDLDSSLTQDSFSEIYLFFDYDGHQDNLGGRCRGDDVVLEMLNTFDNETEQGKLYISYPMVEALRDYIPNDCRSFTDPAQCTYAINKLSDYKHDSAHNNLDCSFDKYTYIHWNDLLNVFVLRVSCLFCLTEAISFEGYRNLTSPLQIFMKQGCYISDRRIFVLSAFPEFLLDYFGKMFWITNVKRSTGSLTSCGHRLPQ